MGLHVIVLPERGGTFDYVSYHHGHFPVYATQRLIFAGIYSVIGLLRVQSVLLMCGHHARFLFLNGWLVKKLGW